MFINFFLSDISRNRRFELGNRKSVERKLLFTEKILEKYSMKKENLWEETREESGISEEFFNEYLKNQRRACAYKLGKPVRYEVPMELIRMGINYVPQSYVYVKTRELNGAEAAGEQTKIWTG